MHLNVCSLTHCLIVTWDGVTELHNFGSRNDYLSGSSNNYLNLSPMTSRWLLDKLKSPASWLVAQFFVRAPIRETSKLCVTGLCEGNKPGTGGFPFQRVSNAENVLMEFQWYLLEDNFAKGASTFTRQNMFVYHIYKISFKSTVVHWPDIHHLLQCDDEKHGRSGRWKT